MDWIEKYIEFDKAHKGITLEGTVDIITSLESENATLRERLRDAEEIVDDIMFIDRFDLWDKAKSYRAKYKKGE